jgi:hypothetical protein
LPWAHQVDCKPPLENAAFNGVAERVAARAARRSSAPNADATPAAEAAARMPRLLVFDVLIDASSLLLGPADGNRCDDHGAARPVAISPGHRRLHQDCAL